MKRSEINAAIKWMEKMLLDYKVALPPFCKWTPQDWQEKGHEYDDVRENMLGWDITDYGQDRFDELGFTLITLRNGSQDDQEGKTYAEKLLLCKEGQYAPMHFHYSKMEDIINKGGGNVFIQVYNAAQDESYADTDVVVKSDGRTYTVPAGSKIRLTPGQSITIYPYLYHDFTVEEGSGDVLLGEVSKCNDDAVDNRFYEELARFPEVIEDEPAYRLLCNEYPKAKD